MSQQSAEAQAAYSVVKNFVRCWLGPNPLKMSPRMVTKRLQTNCQARRTDQQPPDQSPTNTTELPIFQHITRENNSHTKAIRGKPVVGCRRIFGSLVSSVLCLFTSPWTQPRTDDVTSIGDETFAIQLPGSVNTPTTRQRTRATHILQDCQQPRIGGLALIQLLF
ncbi:hypothetical protein T265_02557 [Opisthorchis viverrini]|uniref:Uncharacterized protein n=1 Tax=Opisthorchis viverrini TaxID=6198 RepID=A0A074ZYN8_OPIVI|nr:hypothetical protein T265_02557 [Opisthorchis viverrini]KER31102.1 hypothetical protein T265_02557 [Opisthorchis viverrini]